MELSLCMIVKDEEGCLDRCLRSVKDAVDEMIILDTGSKDATKEIARRYTEHVYDYVWQDDFAGARNASFALAAKPFILWLDADDVIEPAECEKLMTLKKNLHDGIDAVMMPYQYAFSADGNPSLVFDRERIVRRAAGFLFSGAVHEAMAVSGNVIRADIAVRHTGQHGGASNKRNLAIYEKQIADQRELSPRDWYYYARELKSAGEYMRAADAYDVFLSMDGWQVNRQAALLEKGECLEQTGRRLAAKRSYFAALETGEPTAETLCALGACFLAEDDLRAAALWYRAALLCSIPQDRRAFVFPDAYGYIPLMQLCMILSRLGEEAEASRMNEQALLLRPGDPAALYNRAYFAQRLKDGRQDMKKTGWEE